MSPDVGGMNILENSGERTTGAMGAGAALPRQGRDISSLLQLAVTVITHFGHAIFHVFQRVSVSTAAPANNPATAMTVVSAESEAEI